jgi:hypothetical protein
LFIKREGDRDTIENGGNSIQCSQFLQCLTGYAYIHTFAVGITNWTQKFTTARSDLVPVFWPQSWLSDI